MKIALITFGIIGTLIGVIDLMYSLAYTNNVITYIIALFILAWGVVSVMYGLRRKS